jgi:hypothetical protein
MSIRLPMDCPFCGAKDSNLKPKKCAISAGLSIWRQIYKTVS